MGCWGHGSYLADSWNRLDLFIVLAGALEYCLNVENMNLSAIRTIRVLRPLRAINRIPSKFSNPAAIQIVNLSEFKRNSSEQKTKSETQKGIFRIRFDALQTCGEFKQMGLALIRTGPPLSPVKGI